MYDATHPNANDAGTPSNVMLANDLSIRLLEKFLRKCSITHSTQKE
jgi:hypothetical protein